MVLEFTSTIWYWKGPAPFHFVSVPKAESAAIKSIERLATYGWGMIPVDVTIGSTTYYTALWPKDGAYIVPIKAAVRKAEKLNIGDPLALRIEVLKGHA